MPTIGFTMSLDANDEGQLCVVVSPCDEKRFIGKQTLLVLKVWRELPDILRCSVQHPTTGTIAYLQGNDELIELFRAIGLRL